MQNRGSAVVIVILILAAAALFAFIATQPKPKDTWNDEVAARREINSLTDRLWLYNGVAAILTIVGFFITPAFSGFWPAYPSQRYMRPALTLCCAGLVLLLLLMLSAFWAPASIVFGYDPRVRYSTAIAPHLLTINALAASLLLLPLLIGAAAYLLHHLLAHVSSPVAKARKATKIT